MSLSMRQQTLRIQRRKKRQKQALESKQEALNLLCRTHHPIRKIATMTGISKTAVGYLKERLRADTSFCVSEDPCRAPGRTTVLSLEEEKMVVERLVFAANRGFAVDIDGVKTVMSRIAADGRKGWKHGVPSDDAIRSFRARNRDIIYRNCENKDAAKLKGENYYHVKRYFDILTELNSKHLGIMLDGDRIWNVDETSVDSTFGRKIKVFGSSGTPHGGFRSSACTAGSGRHITAVVAVSTSGRKAPRFFIVAGKHVMSNWLRPIPSQYVKSGGYLEKYGKPSWFPLGGVIKCSENGSMKMDILVALVQHLNNYVRSILPTDLHYILSLDGHASRRGTRWLEVCLENRCEVVQSPSNTTHFVQPCDQQVNKTFQKSVRSMRDDCSKHARADTRGVQFNLVCGVHGFDSIRVSDIRESFKNVGIFPFQPTFADSFRSSKQNVLEKAAHRASQLSNSGAGDRVGVLQERKTDKETFSVISKIVNQVGVGKENPYRALQQVSVVLRNRETVNSILQSAISAQSSSTVVSNTNDKNVALMCGAPAECLTIGESLKRRMLKAEEDEAARQDKKIKRAEADAAREAAAEIKLQKKFDKERVREMKRIEVERKKSCKENKRISVAAFRSVLTCTPIVQHGSSSKPRKRSRLVLFARRNNAKLVIGILSEVLWKAFSGDFSVHN